MEYGKKARLLTMLAMTALFFLAEIVTGYMTNSMALVADSFHMLSDVLSIVIGYLAVHYSDKKSKTNTYDWARAEILGAMANAVFLMALVFTIVVAAIQRIIVVEPITQPLLVLGVGAAGLLINLIGLAIFGGHAHGHDHGDGHDHGHGHSHGHDHKHSNDHGHDHKQSHDHEHRHDENDANSHGIATTTAGKQAEAESEDEATNVKSTKKTRSTAQMNMQAVFLHVLGDALGSVVVIISALIIHFVQDDWRFYVDPVMSLVTSIIISWTTIPLLRRASMILLQNPPRSINVDDVKAKVTQVSGVLSIHDLHVWQLSGTCVIATVHVILSEGCNFPAVAKKLKQIFHEVDIHSTTIQPEFFAANKSYTQLALDGAPEDDLAAYSECKCSGVTQDGGNHTCRKFSGNSSSDEEAGSDISCLLSCLSDDCLPLMCCDGVRQRNGSKKEVNQFTNPGFEDNLNSLECTSVEVESCERL